MRTKLLNLLRTNITYYERFSTAAINLITTRDKIESILFKLGYDYVYMSDRSLSTDSEAEVETCSIQIIPRIEMEPIEGINIDDNSVVVIFYSEDYGNSELVKEAIGGETNE